MADKEGPRCSCEPKTTACWEHYFYFDRAEVRRETERRKQGSKLPEFQPKQPENPPQ